MSLSPITGGPHEEIGFNAQRIVDEVHNHARLITDNPEAESSVERVDYTDEAITNKVTWKVFENVATMGFTHCREKLDDPNITGAKKFAYGCATFFSGIEAICFSWNIGLLLGGLSAAIADKTISPEEIVRERGRQRVEKGVNIVAREAIDDSLNAREKQEIIKAMNDFRAKALKKDPNVATKYKQAWQLISDEIFKLSGKKYT